MNLLKAFVLAIIMVLITIALPILLVLLFVPEQSRATIVSQCPAGSYEIDISKDGSPICKLEPTGCPYGDSIPLGPECDKHAPAEPQVLQAVTPEPENVTQYGGK